VNDKVTCEPSNGGCRDIESAYSAGEDEEDEDKGDEWEAEKAEAEGVVPDRDGNKNKKTLLSSSKKRRRSTTGKRPPSQRCSKRRRFSSLLSSDNETESNDETVISKYTSSKPLHKTQRRNTATVSGGEEWKIKKIQAKRFIRDGKGEMCKQYRVRWGHSWVDAEDIDAPKLIRDFEAAQRPRPSRRSQAVHADRRGKGQGLGRGPRSTI